MKKESKKKIKQMMLKRTCHMLGLNIPMGIMTQSKEEDVVHTLEVVDVVVVKVVDVATLKIMVNVTPRKTVEEMNKKYTPPKIKSNTDEDDVWYFNNGSSLCVSIKGKSSILFQGKNKEQNLLKDVYYIPALRSNVISLGQATISGYDISIQDDFLTMRDSCESLLINVPRSANRLYKTQLKVVVDEEANPHNSPNATVHNSPRATVHSSLVTVYATIIDEHGYDIKATFIVRIKKKTRSPRVLINIAKLGVEE
nr:putative pol polyprotein [Tanacetum cinerariifolium]